MESFEKLEKLRIDGNKIAILLPNPCNPDYRVIKHAEFFARNGYEVRVYCRWATGLPFKQIINNVTYIRRPITAMSFVIAFIKSLFSWAKFLSATDKSSSCSKS